MKHMVAIIFLFAISLSVFASNKHRVPTVINITETTAISNYSSDISIAVAVAQHHYKATKSLQWSVGVGYVEDSSAVSFGLGKQFGKVFISGNFSSNGNSSAIGIGASGTF